jgi:hypothetical protein
MEAGEVDPGRRDEGEQRTYELGGGEEEVGGAVLSRALHPVGEATVFALFEPLEGEGPASAVLAKPVEALPVIGVEMGVGVQ